MSDVLKEQLELALNALSAIRHMEMLERVQGLEPEIKRSSEIIADEALLQIDNLVPKDLEGSFFVLDEK